MPLDPTTLCPGDVLVHHKRGEYPVDEANGDHVWVRAKRRRMRVPFTDLAVDGRWTKKGDADTESATERRAQVPGGEVKASLERTHDPLPEGTPVSKGRVDLHDGTTGKGVTVTEPAVQAEPGERLGATPTEHMECLRPLATDAAGHSGETTTSHRSSEIPARDRPGSIPGGGPGLDDFGSVQDGPQKMSTNGPEPAAQASASGRACTNDDTAEPGDDRAGVGEPSGAPFHIQRLASGGEGGLAEGPAGPSGSQTPEGGPEPFTPVSETAGRSAESTARPSPDSEQTPQQALPLSATTEEGGGALTPGLHFGVPAEDYHKRVPGVVSSSALARLARSPAHYRAWIDGHDKDTPARALGRAIHAAILEPETFARLYGVVPRECEGRTKGAKQALADWRRANPGRIEVKANDFDTIEHMRRAVWSHPTASKLVRVEGQSEATCVWVDERTGLTCKVRADRWCPGIRAVVDLKSARDASMEEFSKAIANHRYDVQRELYMEGFRRHGARAFIFVAVEKEPPYAVATYQLDATFTARGRYLLRRDMDTMKSCLDTGRWPAYEPGIIRLSPPRWAMYYEEEAA